MLEQTGSRIEHRHPPPTEVQGQVREATQPGPSAAFEMLEYQVEQLTQEPSGTGFDIPEWLDALAEEVDHARGQCDEDDNVIPVADVIPQRSLTMSEIHRQLEVLDQHAQSPKSRADKSRAK